MNVLQGQKPSCIWSVLWVFSLAQVPSTNMEETVFVTYTGFTFRELSCRPSIYSPWAVHWLLFDDLWPLPSGCCERFWSNHTRHPGHSVDIRPNTVQHVLNHSKLFTLHVIVHPFTHTFIHWWQPAYPKQKWQNWQSQGSNSWSSN